MYRILSTREVPWGETNRAQTEHASAVTNRSPYHRSGSIEETRLERQVSSVDIPLA